MEPPGRLPLMIKLMRINTEDIPPDLYTVASGCFHVIDEEEELIEWCLQRKSGGYHSYSVASLRRTF